MRNWILICQVTINMSIKSSFGICRKSGEITNQVIGTKNKIIPGVLLKIILVNKSAIPDRCDVIKLYDRNTKRFGNELFQCEKTIIKILDDKEWFSISNLNEGDNITVNIELPENKQNVDFCIKFIGEVHEFGAGIFYALVFNANPILSEYNKTLIGLKYGTRDKSTICIRGDRLIECLVVPEPTSLQTVKSCMKIDSTNYRSLQPTFENSVTSKYEATSPAENLAKQVMLDDEVLLIDFENEVQNKQPLISFEVSPVNYYGKKTIDFSSNNAIDQKLKKLSNGTNEQKIYQIKQNLQIEEVRNQSNAISNKVPTVILNKMSKDKVENSLLQQPETSKIFVLPVAQQEELVPIDNLYTSRTEIKIPNYRNDTQYGNELLLEESNGMNEYAIQLKRNETVQRDIQATHIHENHILPNTNQYRKDFRIFSNPTANDAFSSLKMASNNIENSSMPANFIHFQLPKIQQDESPLYDDSISCILSQYDSESESSNNYVRQNSPPSPNYTNPIKDKKPRRNHKNRNNISKYHDNISINCAICDNDTLNPIKLNCQHIFCLRCLADSVTSVENASCPFKKDNYKCTLKLGFDNIKLLLDRLKKEGCGDNVFMPKSAVSISPLQRNVFPNNNNNLTEILVYCKQNNCPGVWFVDKTEHNEVYMCPVCEEYNCFKCQAIHSKMSCEEYNQHKPNSQNNKQSVGECRDPNENQFNYQTVNDRKWICEFCEYNDNLMDTAICVICSRTNEKISNATNDLFNTQKTSKWKCKFCTYDDNSMDTAICVVCRNTNEKLVITRKSIDTEYYRLLELEENDTFIPTFVEFECVICTEMVKSNDGVQLRGCLHEICLRCIRQYIETIEQSAIKCPFVECNNILEDREIRSIVLPDVYARHLEKSLRIGQSQIENGYQCCAINCCGWWIFTNGIYKYNCPVCLTENCISCKASHPNIDCKTYQQNLIFSTDENGIRTRQELENMLKTGIAEHCPKCNIVVVKNGGCSVMHCSMCRTGFNWGRNPNRNLNIM